MFDFSAMSRNQEIPRRINHPITELFHMSFVRYSNEEFEFERLLLPALLNYADQQALSVRAYRELHALMVQPEPEGPAHSAPHSGEGVDSRESEPGVQGQLEPRENVDERGSGVEGTSVDQRPETSSIQNVAEHIGQISSEVQMETLFEAAEQDIDEVEQSVPEQFTPPPTYELPNVSDEITPIPAPASPLSVQSDTDLVQKRLHDVFGSESESMDIYSGTGTQILDLPDDSEETVAGPTERDDDSDADMAGPTDIDEDDDDNDDHGDDQNSSSPVQIVSVSDVVGGSEAGVASEIPCDPPVTQEEETRLVEGELVENVEVSLSEGGGKENGESEIGDKIQDETPIQTVSSREATQSGGKHLLLPTIEQDVVVPATQSTTPPSHSTVS